MNKIIIAFIVCLLSLTAFAKPCRFTHVKRQKNVYNSYREARQAYDSGRDRPPMPRNCPKRSTETVKSLCPRTLLGSECGTDRTQLATGCKHWPSFVVSGASGCY